jgi:hypothetical protein
LGLALALLVLGVAAGGCSEGKQTLAPIEKKPVLTLTQTGPLTVELSIAGPVGLRALQARVVYDAAVLKLKAVGPGKAAERLDRIFSSDLASASGSVAVGLSDTRRVRLPARGALLRLELEPVAGVEPGTVTRIQIEDPLGAHETASAQAIAPTSAEVKLP